MSETFSFQTEVKQLLNLMIHSLYSNKEIFLRELISNGSDALDKFRFVETTERNLLASSSEPGIKISVSPENRRLVIEDNGIGMTRDEVVANLGTIANSGTKKFLENLKDDDKKNANLIGQFGVGFYAAFMVSENVIVDSKSAFGGEAVRWESAGDGQFTLSESNRTERGTRIELVLKETDAEFAEEWRVTGIIKKYSNFVTYPIWMDGKEKTERLNQSTPVWAKQKRENKPEDYNELYKQLTHDYEDPILYEHIHAEGLMPFQAVVYIPRKAPTDLLMRDKYGLHLYVKRVSITEKCKELVPEYLRFIAGVVETDELPLNVSREILQHNTKLPTIKKQIVKKTLSALQNLAKNKPEEYKEFYENFGGVLKEGFHFDHENHDMLADLVRFKSSKSGKDGSVTLAEYVERRAANQKEIYFLSGPNYETVARSPHLETLTSRGVEVLFLTDPVDEWVLMSYPKFGEFEFQSIAKGDMDLSGVGTEPEKNDATSEAPPEELSGLIDAIRAQLGKKIRDVKVSKRLTESASCLIADEQGMSSHMERLLRAANKDLAMENKKILEINPSHPLIKNLAGLKAHGVTDEKLHDWIDMIYDTALLAEGAQPRDPGGFAKKLSRMLEGAVRS